MPSVVPAKHQITPGQDWRWRQIERVTMGLFRTVARLGEADGVPARMHPFEPMPIVPADEVVAQVVGALANGAPESSAERIEAMVRDTLPRYSPETHQWCRISLYYLLEHLFDQTGLFQPFVETEADIAPLKNLNAKEQSLVWAANHTSNIDDPMLGLVCDTNGFGLAHFAAGANLMMSPFIERWMKEMNCIKVLRKFESEQESDVYKNVLAHTWRALTERKEDFIVFVEANNRAGARTRNGTLRLPDRLTVIEGIVDAESDAIFVPMALSYSRVPETRKMLTGTGTFSFLRYPHPEPGPRCTVDADSSFWDRRFATLFSRYRNMYGKACVTIGRPFSVKDLLTSEDPYDIGDGARRVGEAAMREVARVKKVLPAQVVAEAAEKYRDVSIDELTDAVRREIDTVNTFHEETYGEPPNFSREFLGDARDVIEAGLDILGRTHIVRRRAWFSQKVAIRSRNEISYYGNMADHRLFSADWRDKVAVIGAGRWGYTLAHVIGEKFLNDEQFRRHSIVIFDTREEITQSIRERRIHPQFAEEVEIPKSVYPKFSYKDAIDGAKCIIIATTSGRFREAIQHVGRYASCEVDVVIATKGFCHETHKLMPQVAREELAELYPQAPIHLYVLSGANIAQEVLSGNPCASVLASGESQYLRRVASYLESDTFKVYTNTDPIGTALAGAAKNPYSTMYACAKALELGHNFLGELILLSTEEITTLGVAMGANAATFTEGHAWWPDFHATSLAGRSSRFGEMLGKGEPIDRILKKFAENQEAAETYHATKSLHVVAEQYGVTMPIADLLYKMLYENLPVSVEHFNALLTRR